MTLQRKATLVSSGVAALLTAIKLVVGILSGSVAVLASAVDSVLDLFVSLFNYFAIKNSELPADKEFNYGRGKIEALASVIEGTIIAVSGLFLLYQAAKKAYLGEESSYLDISLIVMVISLVITVSLVIFLDKVAKKTNSMVIKADSLHYKTDVYTNIAVLVSLVLVYFTEIEFIDVIIGSAIAIFIIYSAYELIQEGVMQLLDRAVDEEKVEKIKEIIRSEEKVNDFHFLKTRQAGHDVFVEVHLVFNCLMSLMEAHRATDRIEDAIHNIDDQVNWIINIHMDPYDDAEMEIEKTNK
jgi:ferrous-iron efflux pump FieF